MNKAKPEVKITLDRERTIRFDLNAMASFEEATGKNILNGTFSGSGMSARDIRAMLWACLLHEDSTLTLEQVGALITVENMTDVAARLTEAFEVSMPERKGESAPLAEPTG